MTAPPKPAGVAPAVVGTAFHALDFARFVTDVTAFDWARDGRLDASWTYESGTGTWRKTSDGYQTFFASGASGSIEVRDRTTVTMAVRFFKGGAFAPDLLTADRARMDWVVRQHRYALDSSELLDDGADVSVTLHADFALHTGNPGVLEAAGSLSGWADQVSGERRWRATYDGPATLRFDFPDRYVSCPAQEMSADIRVLSNGAELDRYRGTIAARADESRFAGALESENGAGSYGIDLDRGCPAAASAR